MTRYAVFITTIPLDEDDGQPDYGSSIVGLTTDEEIVAVAQDAFAELIGQEGPSDPFLVNDTQLNAIEASLPQEKHA